MVGIAAAAHQALSGGALSVVSRFSVKRYRLVVTSANRSFSAVHQPYAGGNGYRGLQVSLRCQGVAAPQEAAQDEWRAEDDPQFLAAINNVCNKAVRAMLSENSSRVRELQDDLHEAGNLMAKEGNMEACGFLYVVLQMSNHVLPLQAEQLQGIYGAAFSKMYSLLEESGWQMALEHQEGQQMVDDELLQPPPGLGNDGM